jgi:hypothetical protein
MPAQPTSRPSRLAAQPWPSRPRRPLAPHARPRRVRLGTAAASPLRAPLVSFPLPKPLSLSSPLPLLARSPPSPTSRRSPARPRLARRRRPSPARGEPRPPPFLPPPHPFFPARRSPGPASWRSAARPWWLGSPSRSAPASPALGAPPLPRVCGPAPALRAALARRRGLPARAARPLHGAALRPPCSPWRRGSPARGSARPCALPAVAAWLARPRPRRGSTMAAGARPWRPARPRRLAPDLAAGARPWPRRVFAAVRSPGPRGLLAWLARDVEVWRAP